VPRLSAAISLYLRGVLNPAVAHFKGRDGLQLAYREAGQGRALVLLHGFLSTGGEQWLRFAHAERLVASGRRVIMPDLRGHGDSSRPHDQSAYPPDILAEDGLALLEHLELSDYDLGGYSLGARTTVRMLARGATPGRAIVAGMGLEGILHATDRGGRFRHILNNRGSFPFGSPEWKSEAFLNKIGGDPVALLHVLDTAVDTTPEQLSRIEQPTLVAVGQDDERRESAQALAAALPDGHYTLLPGDHTAAIRSPQLGSAIAEFLDA
jgi:pimeloyl-ACP methyl ester carboxylesterase